MIQVKLTGGPEVVRALEQLTARLQTTVLKDALMQAAEPMARRAASLAPKGDASAPTLSHIVIAPLRRRAGQAGVTVALGPGGRRHLCALSGVRHQAHARACLPAARPFTARRRRRFNASCRWCGGCWRRAASRPDPRPGPAEGCSDGDRHRPAAPPIPVEVALRTLLVNDAALTALVGTRVYQLILPQNAALPAVRLQILDEPVRAHLRGIDTLREALVQVDAYGAEAQGYSAIAVVADAVARVLLGAPRAR